MRVTIIDPHLPSWTLKLFFRWRRPLAGLHRPLGVYIDHFLGITGPRGHGCLAGQVPVSNLVADVDSAQSVSWSAVAIKNGHVVRRRSNSFMLRRNVTLIKHHLDDFSACRRNRRLYKEPQVTQVIRSNRLRWLDHIWRSPENNQTRAYTFKNPMGSRTRGRPPTRWIDVENDLKTFKY
ncbi:uncharacterized protein TNCV_1319241 [Trichonephila clavipes]|nr:uncharacterized protein TNCV_1319241 [Trichonephila clavipes]